MSPSCQETKFGNMGRDRILNNADNPEAQAGVIQGPTT